MTTHLRISEGLVRCGAGGQPSLNASFDTYRVTCPSCRSLGYSRESAPESARRVETFTTLAGIDGWNGFLHLRNVIFVDEGSLVWCEDPDVLAVMPALGDGEVHRYQGVWGEPDPDPWMPAVDTVIVREGIL